MSENSVLFVCLGNICRSPMAEGVFRQLVEEKGLIHLFSIDSCGTSGHHAGEQPDKRMMKTAKQNGFDISGLKSRQFVNDDFQKFVYIIPMDASNMKHIESAASALGINHPNIILMRDFDPLDKGADVPDPYWSSQDGFTEVLQILQRSSAALLEFILDQKK